MDKRNTRRSVACKSCHSLKVKCTPSDEKDPTQPCVRCLNAKRKCEIDVNHIRKRRKKAEILREREERASPDSVDDTEDVSALRQRIRVLEEALRKRDDPEEKNDNAYVSKYDVANELHTINEMSSRLAEFTNTLKVVADKRTTLLRSSGTDVDIISKGILSMEQAEERLAKYRTSVYASHPLVEIPPHITVGDLRRDQPHLLNAIMSVTNSVMAEEPGSDLSIMIDNFAIQALTFEIMALGTKSPELIKCLILLCLWYNTPELFRHRRYHMLNTISVTMLHDLGVSRPSFVRGSTEVRKNKNGTNSKEAKYGYNWYQTPVGQIAEPIKKEERKIYDTHNTNAIPNAPLGPSRYPSAYPGHFPNHGYHYPYIPPAPQYPAQPAPSSPVPEAEPDEEPSLEFSSLVLIIYFSTVSICLILRRTIYVKWTEYVEESCVRLEKSGEPRFLEIALYSRLSSLLEQIHYLVHSVDTSDRRPATSRFVVAGFQRSLNDLKAKIGPDQHCQLAFFYSVEAYLHEPSLQTVFRAEQPDETALSESSMRIVTNCTDSCMNALDEFNKLSPEEIAKVPIFLVSRASYTAGMLLRLRYFVLSLPSRVEKYLFPREALLSIKKLIQLVDEASAMYSANHSLMKARFVLQLFIQTYASRFSDLVKKKGKHFPGPNHPGGVWTKPELGRYAHLFAPCQYLGRSLTKDNFDASMPLELLSFAATYEEDKGEKDEKVDGFLPDVEGISSWTPEGMREDLENSYFAVNDEFWADLLSTESDRVNFSNSMGGEVFFNRIQ